MSTTKTKALKLDDKGPARTAVNAMEVLTLAEAAVFLRVPEADLLRLAKLHEVPARKIGDEWRFLKTALQDWLGAASLRKGLLSQIGALEDDPHREDLLKEIYARRGRSETEDR
jgi:excisionase family DNA binding protein